MSDDENVKKNRCYGVIRPSSIPGANYLVAEVMDRGYLVAHGVDLKVAAGSRKRQIRKLRKWLLKELESWNALKDTVETIEWP